jgi:predicted ATPase
MRRLDELTLNKLQFSKLGKLYGREVECQQVLDAWRDTCLAWVHAATTLSSADSSPDEEAAGAPTQSRATPAASPSFDAGGSKSPLSGSRRVVVAIHGEAGAGKTRLAESVRAKAVGDGGLFLTGKFCQPTQSQLSDGGHHCHQQLQLGGVEPYSAFASACFDLWQSPTDENPEPSQARRRRSVLFTSTVNQLQQGSINGDGDEEESPLLLTHGQFLARVSKEIGDKDAAHLIRVIPGLAPLLQRQGITSSTPQASGPPETIEHKKSDLQFKLAFRRLIRLVSKMKPICLVIDDLQWADSGSLELLERLLSDPEELSLMVVVCYREEVPGAHLKTLESIRAMGVSPDIGVRVENIRVGNLDANHLNELLTDLLSLPESETQGLATCICKKTLGNVFFVTQFLGMLQASKLLKYNIGTLKWTFSLLAIQDSMGATDNAANLVKVKFKHLPKSVVRVLPAMACLGLTVQIEMFELALNHCEWPVEPEVSSIDEEARDPEDFQPLESKASLLLKQCEAEGLLEARMGHEDVSYRWVHDKIQEAAFSLIDYPDLQELKLSIGKVLCEKLDPEALEANLFLVANLLISFDPVSGSTIFEEPVKVVELFHWAGSKAMNSSAFELALGYLQAGIKVLPDNHWETHEALSLELYSTAAEAAFGLGDFGTSQQYYDEAILRTPGLPLADRRRVYDVMIACTAAQQGIEAGFYACKSLLARLGCVFPRRWVAPLHVLASLLRIKISRRRNLPETILQRGELHHPTTIWIMSLLDRLATYAYVTDPTLLCVILFRCINITLQEGICQYSPAIFALVGFLLSAFMNDYGRGHAFATHAIDLLHHVKSASRVESRVTFLAHAFVFHWTRPFQFSVKPLLASFSAGMASGDTESAALSINLYLEYCFRMGTPLPILLEDYAHYTKLIRDVNQTKILAIIVNLWQVVFFLTGQNEFTGPLTGDIVNQESALLDVSAEDFNYLFFAINRMQMYAAFVLGKHIEVYKSIIRTSFSAGAYERIFPGIFGLIHLYAYNGLSMFSLYRESNDKKYLKLAKKFAAMIKKWARSGVRPRLFAFLIVRLVSMKSNPLLSCSPLDLLSPESERFSL